MTSGNLTDEPICFEDADARQRLGAIADAWLLHDRPIHVPCDDSVLQLDPATGEELPLRRSRGYAPLPVRLPLAAPPTLAVGGELKNAFCVAAGRDAFMSQHIGDMGSLETWAAFERSTRQIAGLYGIEARVVSADTHPGYQTTRWAEEATNRGRGPSRGAGDAGAAALAEVQHHHAHIAAVMAEHGVPATARVIGLACDGTGYGDDGTIWGGEILVAGYLAFERVGSLTPVPLPGGDAAIRRPCRVALAHLWAAGIEWADDLAPVEATSADERAVLARQLDSGVGTVATSSMGRLFDAVSSLVGLRHDATYEAQAAMELQWAAEATLARAPESTRPYRFALTEADGRTLMDPGPVLHALVADRRRRVAPGAGDGRGLPARPWPACRRRGGNARPGRHRDRHRRAERRRVPEHPPPRAGPPLSSGARGFRVLSTHQRVPPNDGGLALGQAVVAAARALATAAATTSSSRDRGIVAVVEHAPILSDGSAAPAAAEDLAAAARALARRFAAGATMWCVAPEWPSHARHVAVEFVHPVIVGKRALPAVSIDAGDPLRSRRRWCASWPGRATCCSS